MRYVRDQALVHHACDDEAVAMTRDDTSNDRPFWQDLALACAPAVLGALVSGVCSMVSEALAHRRERDEKPRDRKRMN